MSDISPTSGLAKSFGDKGPLVGGIGFGVVLVLVGLLIVVFQTRSINAGAKRHEAELREKMELTAGP